MTAADQRSSLRVHRIEWAAEGILEVELRDPSGADLAAFGAGAHVDLVLPNGITRSYSLANDPAERHRWVLGIGLDPASRGGSRFVHRDLRVGETLTVIGPRNHFPLDETAAHSVLIAGGIGITPMISHARALAARGEPFRLVYAGRSRAAMAYADELVAEFGARVELRVSEAGERIDPAAEIARCDAGAALWFCGPHRLLDDLRHAWTAAGRPELDFRFENFGGHAGETAATFVVAVPRHGIEVTVPADRSMLEALEAAGLDLMYDCRRGECGLCALPVTAVEGGAIVHHDVFFSDHQKSEANHICPCVSRLDGGRITVDTSFRPDAI